MTQPRRFVKSGEKLHVMIVISSLLCRRGGKHLFLCPELGRRNTVRGRLRSASVCTIQIGLGLIKEVDDRVVDNSSIENFAF